MRQRGAPLSATLARVRRVAADTAAEAQIEIVHRLVQACFSNQQAPDGEKWPERADGTGRPLLLTIGDALTYTAKRGTVYVDCPTKPHAEFQYWGTRYIPSRQWVPSGKLPQSWERAIERAVRQAIQSAIRDGQRR